MSAGASAARRARKISARYFGKRALIAAGCEIGVSALVLASTGSEALGMTAGLAAATTGWLISGKRLPLPALAITSKIGAEGERATAKITATMHREGFRFFHDRALPPRYPGGRSPKANLDHLAVTPCGTVIAVLDSKRWPANATVTRSGGVLRCVTRSGMNRSQEEDIASLLYESDRVTLLAPAHVRVARIVVVHGASVQGGHLVLHRYSRALRRPVEVNVISARYLPDALRSLARAEVSQRHSGSVARWAKQTFPRYRD